MPKRLSCSIAVAAMLFFAAPAAAHPPENPPAVPPATTDTGAPKEPTCKQMQAQLSNLGFNTAGVDGICGPFSKRAYAAFARLAGYRLSLGQTKKSVTKKLMVTTDISQLRKPRRKGTYIEISIRTQTAFMVRAGRYERFMPVSSGSPKHPTPRGSFKIHTKFGDNQVHPKVGKPGWDYSVPYKTRMYRSLYFNGGIALHGSPTDAGVRPPFASHSCVRMLHKDIRYVRQFLKVGSRVYVL